jgi:hypothetical protein
MVPARLGSHKVTCRPQQRQVIPSRLNWRYCVLESLKPPKLARQLAGPLAEPQDWLKEARIACLMWLACLKLQFSTVSVSHWWAAHHA